MGAEGRIAVRATGELQAQVLHTTPLTLHGLKVTPTIRDAELVLE